MNILLANLTKMVDDSGGMAKVTSNFANEMHKRGHDIALVYSDEKEGEFFYSIDEGIPVYDVRHYEGKEISYPWYLKLKREFYRMYNPQKARTVNNDFAETFLVRNLSDVIQKRKPDVIVSFQPAASKLLISDLKVKIPVITMSHGDPEDYFHTYPEKEIPAIEQSTVNQVLLPSFANHIKNHLPKARTIVIGNAIDQCEKQADLLAEKEVYKVIFVGRLSKNHKRPHLLIDAFAEVASSYPNWILELWGAEDGKAYYYQLKEKVKSLQLDERIFFKGTTQNIYDTLLGGDICAVTSAFEGFSLSMAEAMSAGLPVVGYKETPSVNELIRDRENGLLVDEGSKPLAKALSQLMADKSLRHQLGSQGRKDMMAYSPENIWNQWEELMESVSKNERKG